MDKECGKIIIAPDLNVWPHELETAKALAQAGYTVEFVRKSDVQHQRTADVLIDGEFWEMKSPQANSVRSVERNLRRGTRQSSNIVFDSQRIKRVPDAVIEKRLRYIASHIKAVKRLQFINRKREVVDII